MELLEIECEYATINREEDTWFVNIFNPKASNVTNLNATQKYKGIKIVDNSGISQRMIPFEVVQVIESKYGPHYIIKYRESHTLDPQHVDIQYLDMVNRVLTWGARSENRTDTETIKMFGSSMTFDLRKGFPLVTSKYVHLDAVIHELLWFFLGQSNIQYLKDNNVRIWNEWATESGELGPVYGVQWRNWEDRRVILPDNNETFDFLKGQGYTVNHTLDFGTSQGCLMSKNIDQIQNVLDSLKNNPNDRRMIVTGMNPGLTPVTKITMSVQERLEHYLSAEADRVANDSEWLAQTEELKKNPDNIIPTDPRKFVESLFYSQNVFESSRENWDPENNLEHAEILLNEVNAPIERFFTPSENAAVGQQALPPCHMMFQFGTSPIPTLERVEIYIQSRVETLLENNFFLTAAEKRYQDEDAADPATQARDTVEGHFWENNSTNDLISLREYLDAHDVPKYYLDLNMYQRSADLFLGVPFNIASYSLMLLIFAQLNNMVARNYMHIFGDYHVYENHQEQLEQQMAQDIYPMPTMEIKPFSSLEDLTFEHFKLKNYEHGPKITGKVAV